jgi:hypothetical protein
LQVCKALQHPSPHYRPANGDTNFKRHEETEKESRESCILPPVTSTNHKHKADADLTQKQLQLKGFGPNFSNMNL